MLGPELDLEMRQYVRDGAHYVPTVTQVAYEEQQWADQSEARKNYVKCHESTIL